MSPDDLKKLAAARALELVTPGMRLGLGTGSTAKHFVDLLGARVAEGLEVVCVSTSEATEAQARALAIPMSTLDETPELDLTIDGADEVDRELRLIKGGGAALLREKIVAAASARMVVIADDTKLVERLGRFPLPIEVVPFGLEATRRAVLAAMEKAAAPGELVLRRKADGSILLTDGGHYILDAHPGVIADPEGLAAALSTIPGVVEHGLFLGLASAAILAGRDGLIVLGSLD
ncbi:MAG: ribose-5-phosphate isomerase RpiA [Bosea sp. (in: a-proteobacteria)]|uniref:ribose-5-phosphate isomerase RpiA n=1 Tax=Bosea sp. (in: a-proteobacteria) TaxID=1871050 RepID=UPI002734BFE9|nr:ribose-5-phosphate isomerase RpiA [Bosea sp. (in: a-proteobacteria)]MDP3255492.1 ribose-5-phosphate isomerase RpiA [Bosea sp. (in: a-proteobacteria)]MDP3321137.1 ribose-5-phosphate isomerase RpiA [Bosea sp. (in: a-proteobacteria)]